MGVVVVWSVKCFINFGILLSCSCEHQFLYVEHAVLLLQTFIPTVGPVLQFFWKMRLSSLRKSFLTHILCCCDTQTA